MTTLIILSEKFHQNSLLETRAAIELIKSEFNGRYRGHPSPLGFGIVYEAEVGVRGYLDLLGAVELS